MKKKKKIVLVTGANGFVGSHVLEALQACEELTLIAACRDPAKLLPGFSGEVRQGDLTDSGYVEDVAQGVDVICHAAAWTSMWGHRRTEERLFREPTIALIDSAIAAGVERFIFDSATVVTGPHRDGSPVGDSEPAARQGFWPHIDMVADIEKHMCDRSDAGTSMVSLRCGHFVGARYKIAFTSLIVPKLKTHLVPWVAGGRGRMPLVDGRDMGEAFALASKADGLRGFHSFNICGPSFPTMREVIDFIHDETGVPKPHFSVPRWGAYLFGWLMEKLNPVLPGDPFLTRSIVYLGEDWYAPSDLAKERLGYVPKHGWKEAVRHELKNMEVRGSPRTRLADAVLSRRA